MKRVDLPRLTTRGRHCRGDWLVEGVFFSAVECPNVSIGLPVYNGATYLAEAIQSILRQTYTDLELIIADNASQDGTEAIARSHARMDSRIRYYQHDANLGAAANFNFVVARARGSLFKWAAHDDLIEPTFLEQCVDALQREQNAVLAFSNTTVMDHEDTRRYLHQAPWFGVSPERRLRDLLLEEQSYILHCFPIAGVLRMKALRETRLIQPFQSADKVLLVELALRGDFVRVPEWLFIRRMHSTTSRRANVDPEDIAFWFDSRRASGFPMPRTTLFRAYISAVRDAPLRRTQRAKCYATIARWLVRGRTIRAIVGEHRIAARERLLVARRRVMTSRQR